MAEIDEKTKQRLSEIMAECSARLKEIGKEPMLLVVDDQDAPGLAEALENMSKWAAHIRGPSKPLLFDLYVKDLYGNKFELLSVAEEFKRQSKLAAESDDEEEVNDIIEQELREQLDEMDRQEESGDGK